MKNKNQGEIEKNPIDKTKVMKNLEEKFRQDPEMVIHAKEKVEEQMKKHGAPPPPPPPPPPAPPSSHQCEEMVQEETITTESKPVNKGFWDSTKNTFGDYYQSVKDYFFTGKVKTCETKTTITDHQSSILQPPEPGTGQS